ncbi:MAG: tetratricopeptide repeat protein [Bacteroidales bacterium]|nr:tetratricopeptide repeat protein [Bacteroidales bacterium]
MIKTMFVTFFIMSLIGSLSANEDQTTDAKVKGMITIITKNMQTNPDKAIYYLEEALNYEKQTSQSTLCDLYRTAGVLYLKKQSCHLALDYFYKSLEIQNIIDKSKNHYIYNNIGGAYLALGDTVKATEFWLLSLQGLKQAIKRGNLNEKHFESYIVYNNLAVLERQKGNYFKALEMLNEYKGFCLKVKDTLGIIRAYQNLSNVYFQIKEYDSARLFFRKGSHLAEIINSTSDLASFYYNMGHQFIELNRDSSLYYFLKSYKISCQYELNQVKLVSAEAISDLYEMNHEYRKSNEYLHIAKKMSEENINIESKKKISLMEFEHEQKMKQQELLLDTQQRKNILVFSTIFFILVSILAFLLYQLQKNIAKRRRLENELLIQRLEEKNKELTTNMIQNIQTSEILEFTHKGLQELREKTEGTTNRDLSQIIKTLKNGNRSFNKKEFEKLFIETDKGFYKKLLSDYPTLTNNEIRHCVFAKMNLSSKEISAITQQSQNSILVARSRLRKKLGLKEDQGLTSFFNNF